MEVKSKIQSQLGHKDYNSYGEREGEKKRGTMEGEISKTWLEASTTLRSGFCCWQGEVLAKEISYNIWPSGYEQHVFTSKILPSCLLVFKQPICIVILQLKKTSAPLSPQNWRGENQQLFGISREKLIKLLSNCSLSWNSHTYITSVAIGLIQRS